MLNRILRSALMAGSVWLAGIHLASADIIPNPARPTPTATPDINQIIGPLPTPTPPVATPTVPPVNPPPVSTPTLPPVNPPPIPNTNALGKADPQIARATVYYGQNGVLGLLNDRGRFQKVAVQAGEVVTILVTLSPIDYGKAATIQLLDGGAMTTAVTLPQVRNPLPPGPGPTINSATDATTPPPPTATPNPSTLVDTGALMTVTQAGELAFGFKPGADAGLHRISVIVGGNQYYLQFWRQDPSAPNNNPRMLHAY